MYTDNNADNNSRMHGAKIELWLQAVIFLLKGSVISEELRYFDKRAQSDFCENDCHNLTTALCYYMPNSLTQIFAKR